MSSNKLKKFTSFRHPKENVKEKNGISKEPKLKRNYERRKSFSSTETSSVDVANSSDNSSTKSDFLRLLRKHVQLEGKINLTSVDKRKSASIGHIDTSGNTWTATEKNASTSGSSRKSLRNPALFLSDGNLAASLVDELKKRLALRAEGKTQNKVLAIARERGGRG